MGHETMHQPHAQRMLTGEPFLHQVKWLGIEGLPRRPIAHEEFGLSSWQVPINPKKRRRKPPSASIMELTKPARTIFFRTVSINNMPPCGTHRENSGRQAIMT